MMDASNIGQAAPDRSTPAVVRPSGFVRVVMGPMTKMLNPAMRRLAGRRHVMMAAQVHHVGPIVTETGPIVTETGAIVTGGGAIVTGAGPAREDVEATRIAWVLSELGSSGFIAAARNYGRADWLRMILPTSA